VIDPRASRCSAACQPHGIRAENSSGQQRLACAAAQAAHVGRGSCQQGPGAGPTCALLLHSRSVKWLHPYAQVLGTTHLLPPVHRGWPCWERVPGCSCGASSMPCRAAFAKPLQRSGTRWLARKRPALPMHVRALLQALVWVVAQHHCNSNACGGALRESTLDVRCWMKHCKHGLAGASNQTLRQANGTTVIAMGAVKRNRCITSVPLRVRGWLDG
jgi:hypothetical protein